MTVKKDDNIHTSVLVDELVQSLETSPTEKNIIVDATLGLAWHAEKIIEKMHDGDIFVGFDADERNLKIAKQKLKHIQTKTQSAAGVDIILLQSNFVHLKQKLKENGIDTLTGIYYDLWVSSVHFDEADRGFSFRLEGPLDMRFDATQWQTAAEILNYSQEKDLYEILKNYGEEPHSRKIAAKIIEARKRKKFATTHDLVEFLETEINTHIKTKMRVFQALRIAVNNELENLQKSLEDAIDMLDSKGKIFAISFHSLEDRIVKQTFKRETRDCICQDMICSCKHKKSLKILTKKPIIPTEEEQKNNPRSKSAKARCAQKL